LRESFKIESEVNRVETSFVIEKFGFKKKDSSEGEEEEMVLRYFKNSN